MLIEMKLHVRSKACITLYKFALKLCCAIDKKLVTTKLNDIVSLLQDWKKLVSKLQQ